MPSVVQAIRRPLPGYKEGLLVLLLTAVYVEAGRFGLSLAYDNPSASPVWPPTGIAIAATLILGARIWPAWALGSFLVNMGATGAIASSLGIAAGNTLEALLATWLVTRFANGHRAFETTRDMLKFVALAGLVSPLASATPGVIILALGGHAASEHIPAIWLTWWLGNVVGALLIAPPILVWHSQPNLSWTRRQVVELSLWASLLGLVSVSFFTSFTPAAFRPYIRPFPLIPLLICISIRFGTREAATGLLFLSGIAIRGTLNGFGPFVLPSPNDSLLLLQSFLGVASVLTLAPAVMVAERRRAETRLQASFDQALVGMADCDLNGRFLRVNQRFCDMLGYTRDELFKRSLIDVTHPDDRGMTRERLGHLKREGASNAVDKRYVRFDGTTLWVRVLASRVVPGPGHAAYAATVVEDITSRKHAEDALQKAAMLEERNRLAGEIHDNLAQSFVGIILQLENAVEILPEDWAPAREHMERATRLARAALDHARRSILDLRPSELETNELPTALGAAAAGLLAGTGVELDFRCDGTVRRLDPDIEEQLFYIAKEAIANAWRHGSPHRLSCHMRYEAAELSLEVADDGRGFEVGQVPESDAFGLANMHERARRIGARITIQSVPGDRTSVLLRLPLVAAETATPRELS
jgi:PAS domain S-box-containing protein